MKFNWLSSVLKFAVTDKCSFYFHRIDAELPNKDLGGEMCLAHSSGLEIVVKK